MLIFLLYKLTNISSSCRWLFINFNKSCISLIKCCLFSPSVCIFIFNEITPDFTYFKLYVLFILLNIFLISKCCFNNLSTCDSISIVSIFLLILNSSFYSSTMNFPDIPDSMWPGILHIKLNVPDLLTTNVVVPISSDNKGFSVDPIAESNKTSAS